jgi:translation initiation factor eIF-2B subunit delta
MRETTRVLLGASALLSNGAILGAAGTAMIASLARAQRVPVIFAAEIYKFSEKNQLDSIVFNELGDESEVLVSKKGSDGTDVTEPSSDSVYQGAANSSGNTSLPFQVINLRYDLTNIINVSVVATENGLIPATSIPVLIREMRPDIRSNEN